MVKRAGFLVPLVIAGIYLYLNEHIAVTALGDPLGPRAFPRIIAAVLALSSVLMLFEDLRKPATAEVRTSLFADGGILVSLTVLGWTVLYFQVFELAGYMISTTIYLLALLMFFHRGKTVVNVVTALAFSVGGYFIFTKLLVVPLPAGAIFPDL